MSRRPVVKCLPKDKQVQYMRAQWARQRQRKKKRREEAKQSNLAKYHEMLAKEYMNSLDIPIKRTW